MKLYREPWRRVNELDAIALAQKAGAPVAKVLWTGKQPANHTCFSYVPGPTLASSSGAQSLPEALDYLDLVHAVTGEQFGRLTGPSFSDWPSFLHSRLLQYRATFLTIDLIGPASVTEALASIAPPVVATPRLIHNDPNPSNFIASSRTLVAVDWELAAFADPELDVGRAAWEWGYQPPDIIASRPNCGYDLDKLWYYEAFHTLGRLMSVSASARPNVRLARRCRDWLAVSPWRSSMKIWK